MEVHLGTTVENVLGNSGEDGRNGSPVTGVLVRDDHGAVKEMPVRGLFYAIGHNPNTKLLQVRDTERADQFLARLFLHASRWQHDDIPIYH